MAEIEACLNSRPLCALSNGALSPTYLSHGHFLFGEPLYLLTSLMSNSILSTWQTYKQLQQFGNGVHPSTETSTTTTLAEDVP
jgi:hypothetical protein